MLLIMRVAIPSSIEYQSQPEHYERLQEYRLNNFPDENKAGQSVVPEKAEIDIESDLMNIV
jgi:hypothetical protein